MLKKSVEGGVYYLKQETSNSILMLINFICSKKVGWGQFLHNLIFYIYLRKMFAATCQRACCEHSYKLYNFGIHCA